MTDRDARDHGDRARLLRSGLEVSGLSMAELEAGCLGIGDDMTQFDLALALSGRGSLPDGRYDVIAQAINDRLVELGLDHLVPSVGELDGR